MEDDDVFGSEAGDAVFNLADVGAGASKLLGECGLGDSGSGVGATLGKVSADLGSKSFVDHGSDRLPPAW